MHALIGQAEMQVRSKLRRLKLCDAGMAARERRLKLLGERITANRLVRGATDDMSPSGIMCNPINASFAPLHAAAQVPCPHDAVQMSGVTRVAA
jgi:hypothetical protein